MCPKVAQKPKVVVMISLFQQISNLEIAQQYKSIGLSVVPIVPAQKVPFLGQKNKPYFARLPTDSELLSWFGSRDSDIACCLGKVSGSICLRDFDDMASYHLWASEQPELALHLPTSATGRDGGGRHVYCRTDLQQLRDCSVTGRGESLHLPDGGHLKGSKQLAYLTPSRHPSGRAYEWLISPLIVGFPVVPCLRKAGLLPSDVLPRPKVVQAINDTSLRFSANQIPSSRLPELSIDWAIKTTLPTAPGQRHLKIFQFIRRLRSMPQYQKADPQNLYYQVLSWHKQALPFISTKDFNITWTDFLSGWSLVQFPFGASIQVAAHHAHGKTAREYINSFCKVLQSLWGDQPFFLSVRTAGFFAGVSQTTAHRILKRLQNEGELEMIKKGNFHGRKASLYRYNE